VTSGGDLTGLDNDGLDDDGLADEFASDRLDDAGLVEAADPGGMLRQVASSGAQVRSAVRTCTEVDLSPVTGVDRPRAIVVAGMGGSGIAGDVLAAVCGTSNASATCTSRNSTIAAMPTAPSLPGTRTP